MQRFFLQWQVKSFEWCALGWSIHKPPAKHQILGISPDFQVVWGTALPQLPRDETHPTKSPSLGPCWTWVLSGIDGGTVSKGPIRGIWVHSHTLWKTILYKENACTHVKCIYHDTSCILHFCLHMHIQLWDISKPMHSAEDVVATAPTGSGKTLAFLVPAMVPWGGKGWWRCLDCFTFKFMTWCMHICTYNSSRYFYTHTYFWIESIRGFFCSIHWCIDGNP